MMMIRVNIRKQGGAVVMTIPASVLKMLSIEAGAQLELDVGQDSFTVRKIVSKNMRKNYSLQELLQGVTPEQVALLNEQVEWAHEGEPVGRECL